MFFISFKNLYFRDACDYLVSQLLPLSNNEQQIWLARITEFLQKKKTLSDPVVQKHHVVTAVAVSVHKFLTDLTFLNCFL